MSISEAFFKICSDAKPIASHYVSLYCNQSYYGGPEEGGWWGTHVVLVAYQEYDTIEQAARAKELVDKFAKELNEDEKKSFGQQCLNEMEWLEQRGLESDYLPEVDGPNDYFVVVESIVGECQRRGPTHYE